MSISNLLIHTCDIKTLSATKSSTGFASEGVYVDKALDVPCRVTDQTPDRAMMIYGKFDAMTQKRIYFASENFLSVRDLIEWVDPSDVLYTLYVHSVMNQGGNLNRLWAVDVATYPVGTNQGGTT